jgi:hypothetical protein
LFAPCSCAQQSSFACGISTDWKILPCRESTPPWMLCIANSLLLLLRLLLLLLLLRLLQVLL